MATQIDLGAVVPIGKGDWNPSTTYERANIVRHNSVAWICKVATSLGVEPTETSSDWYLLVKDTSSVTSINGMRGDVTIDSVLENPSIDDNSLKIASTAWANTKILQIVNNNSLPLTGGTMTGAIEVMGMPNEGKVASLYTTNQEQELMITSGSPSYETAGSYFSLYGLEYPSDNIRGSFILGTCDNSKEPPKKITLQGFPNGTLIWNHSQVLLPPGSVFAFAGSNVPPGCLPCNGSAVSRTTYANLFNNIGTLYGNGNGSTTFNLPDLRGKFIEGEWDNNNPGSVKEAGLPNITGGAAVPDSNGIIQWYTIGSRWGAIDAEIRNVSFYFTTISGNNQYTVAGFNIDASRNNGIYGRAATVQPPSVTLRYCIKY